MSIERRLGLGLGAIAWAFCFGAGCNDPETDVGAQGTVAPPLPTTGATAGSSAAAPVAGSGAMAPLVAGTGPVMPIDMMGLPTDMMPPGTTTMPPQAGELAMDECGLNTGYPGDEYCILPPPPDKGFQLHIGPSDYANPEARYVLSAGQELTSSFDTTSGNTTDVYFYYRQFRMRPGAHHNIITSSDGGGFGMGRRIGTSNHLAEDSPEGGLIAPENEGVGIPLAPNSGINVSLHSINTTTEPLLREVWINFWYRDPALVTEPVEEMFQTGSVTFVVQPGQDTILGPFRCSLNGDGRMLWFYGHRHANNVRFSTWRVRGAQRDLIYEGLNWEDPLVLEYSSTVRNPVPNAAMGIEGGWSGILDLRTGDQLEWECHVINKTNGVLTFANETYTAEMCIMDAELVGVNCGAGGGL